jgi:SpoIID/LytB domain protein
MPFSVSIGLLWDEPVLRGELIRDFRVECRTDCCRSMVLDTTTGLFEATAVPGSRTEKYGIRLAECFSLAGAERILDRMNSTTSDLTLDMVEAGRKWETAHGAIDNRLWWPVVKLGSRSEADRILDLLRELPDVNPVGLAVVRLDQADARDAFDFSLGDFSAKVLEVRATPLSDEARFRLQEVPIGRGFHWEHREQLEYRGELRLFHGGGPGLTASNRLPLETYLESAVGSEMRDDLPPAFSQAQAICARSTVLATAGRHHRADGFDLCNDDHCQCYQGTQREAHAVIAPVRETASRVLMFDQRVVDARYAKSCGGVSDRYEAVWGEEGPEYFQVRADGEFKVPDLTRGQYARYFLRKAPDAWCNPDKHPYPEPWNEYPLFRWEFTYSKAELGELVRAKTGKAVGDVQRLDSVSRGASGRILILDVIGSSGHTRIYGELNIRRALSKSHLPSSYFEVEAHDETITLRGGGWGHGVGLCQLGACAMAKEGWSVSQILEHYYPGSALSTL